MQIDNAAGATAAALECPPGAYNVDGNPSPQHVWLAAFARAAGAPALPRVSEKEALRTSGPDAVYYATRLRGASHEKSRRDSSSVHARSSGSRCKIKLTSALREYRMQAGRSSSQSPHSDRHP